MRKRRAMQVTSGFGKGALALPALLAGLLALASCASTSAPPPPQATTATAYKEGVPGGVVVNTLTVQARVTAIDRAERRATLMGPDGKTFRVKAGPEAVNFDQVAVGDLVKLTVTEELVVYLQSEGAPAGEGSAAMVALAPKGAAPAGLVAGTTQSTATVTAIDHTKRTATLRFADGTTKTFPVRPDIDLRRHREGERVVFRHTEMLAIRVEKP